MPNSKQCITVCLAQGTVLLELSHKRTSDVLPEKLTRFERVLVSHLRQFSAQKVVRIANNCQIAVCTLSQGTYFR